MEFSRQEYWSGLSFPPPGDFPTQGLNLRLLHCRQLLYCSPLGKPCVCVCVPNSFLYAVAVVQSHLTLCNSMDCSIPGYPVFAISLSLLKFMSIEAVMLSNQLIRIILYAIIKCLYFPKYLHSVFSDLRCLIVFLCLWCFTSDIWVSLSSHKTWISLLSVAPNLRFKPCFCCGSHSLGQCTDWSEYSK